MSYELWDLESRNLVEEFETEAAALEAARELIDLNASSYPAALALAQRHEDGTTSWLARGEELATRAQAAGSGSLGRPVA